jgi:hypothetical protein
MKELISEFGFVFAFALQSFSRGLSVQSQLKHDSAGSPDAHPVIDFCGIKVAVMTKQTTDLQPLDSRHARGKSQVLK